MLLSGPQIARAANPGNFGNIASAVAVCDMDGGASLNETARERFAFRVASLQDARPAFGRIEPEDVRQAALVDNRVALHA